MSGGFCSVVTLTDSGPIPRCITFTWLIHDTVQAASCCRRVVDKPCKGSYLLHKIGRPSPLKQKPFARRYESVSSMEPGHRTRTRWTSGKAKPGEEAVLAVPFSGFPYTRLSKLMADAFCTVEAEKGVRGHHANVMGFGSFQRFRRSGTFYYDG